MFRISVAQRLALAAIVTLLPAMSILADDLPQGAVEEMGSTRSLGTLTEPAPSSYGTLPAQPALQPMVPTTGGQSSATDTTDSSGMPQPQQAGDVTYITGGIGDEERDMLKAAASQYNLHVTSANATGEFLADLQIAIADAHGRQIVNAAAGPLFMAKLPQGKYTVAATSGSVTKKQVVTIGRGTAPVHFRW